MGFIVSFFHKEPNTITEDDINQLIAQKIQENLNLEYKDIQKFDDPDKLSITISSFANAVGGLIILGVGEKGGFPDRITWADLTVKSKESLENKLFSRIHPRIDNLIIVPIYQKDSENRGIYLIEVPQGDNPPYIAGDKRFYKRINFQKIPMEGYEISDYFGRRKRPKLILDKIVKLSASSDEHNAINLTIGLKNIGKTIAKNTLIHFEFSNCRINKYDKSFKHGGFIRKSETLDSYFPYPNTQPFYPHPDLINNIGNIELYPIPNKWKNHSVEVKYRIMAEDMPTINGTFKIVIDMDTINLIDNHEEELSEW